MRARRNVRDYERTLAHAEAHIQWTFITLMPRRLARPLPKEQETAIALTANGNQTIYPSDGAVTCGKRLRGSFSLAPAALTPPTKPTGAACADTP